MIKAVIFDFGGVIIDIENTGSVGKIMEELEVDPITTRLIIGKQIGRMQVGEISEEEFWRNICQELGKPIPGNWKELWRKPIEENAVLWTEPIQLVGELKEKGILALVLSNTIPPHEEVVRNKGWYDYFDRTYFSNRIGFRKPDVKAFEYVLEKEGLLGSECVFVDDSPENLAPAETLGMKTVLAKSPEQLCKDVRNLVGTAKLS